MMCPIAASGRAFAVVAIALGIASAPPASTSSEVWLDSTIAELVARATAPGTTRDVRAADFEALRDSVDLEHDADPITVAKVPDGDTTLRFAAGLVLPHLARAQHTPMHDALDLSLVRAAAWSFPITAVATDQPFDEIAAALQAAGYARDGDALVYRGSELAPQVVYTQVATAGDGVVILSSAADPGEQDALRRAVEPVDIAAADPVLELMAGLAAPVMSVTLIPPEAEASCVSAIAVAEPLGGPGELLFVATDQSELPEPVVAAAPGLGDNYEFGVAVVDGPIVRLPVVAAAGENTAPVSAFLPEMYLDELYTCA